MVDSFMGLLGSLNDHVFPIVAALLSIAGSFLALRKDINAFEESRLNCLKEAIAEKNVDGVTELALREELLRSRIRRATNIDASSALRTKMFEVLIRSNGCLKMSDFSEARPHLSLDKKAGTLKVTISFWHRLESLGYTYFGLGMLFFALLVWVVMVLYPRQPDWRMWILAVLSVLLVFLGYQTLKLSRPVFHAQRIRKHI